MRGLLALASCLVAHAAYGAAASAPAKVQLQLSFAPAPTGPALLTVGSLPGPLSVSPALQPSFTPIPAAVKATFDSGDADSYLKSARVARYQPPSGDEHQNALYRLGQEREAAERAVRELDRVQAPAVRATVIDYEEFGRQLVRHPGLGPGVFQQTYAKRRILKAAGYARLIGPGGIRISIERADDARVGKAFASVLRTYNRR